MNERITLLFPHDAIRPVQEAFIRQVEEALAAGTSLVTHAPTGIGKTAASLTPALAYALEHNKTVFFLTSRHTQHRIAIDTLRRIKHKAKLAFSVVDIVGKRWMCAQSGAETLGSKQFHDYCRAMREDEQCEYYLHVRRGGNVSNESRQALQALTVPAHSEDVVRYAKACKVCPYEIALLAAQKASVVVADYYYLFSSGIRESFLNKIRKELGDCVLIIDEGHNLPARMRELLTESISSAAVQRAVKEAEKHQREKESEFLAALHGILSGLAATTERERFVPQHELLAAIEKSGYDYDEMATLLELSGSEVQEEQKQSAMAAVASFLTSWKGGDEGYARILTKGTGKYGPFIRLFYRCLDPAIATAETLRQAHASLLMSGTLTPTRMYRDLLGFPEGTLETAYANPFPPENRHVLIIPEATTKFSRRGEAEYKKIAAICRDIVNAVPGNSIIFFPSYAVLAAVHPFLHGTCTKELLKEKPEMSTAEKAELLSAFAARHAKGSALLAVISGNFSEGIDLPGELLKSVVVVGLPLQQPDLETKALIDYYQQKFGKGWDYGYVLPAFTKALQSAGRCIRSETDKGVVAFVDERYAWPRYYDCFPKDWRPEITSRYAEKIRDFFATK